MLRAILFTILLLLLPDNLVCGDTDFFVEKWPCVIMAAGDVQYVMDGPGAPIRVVETNNPQHEAIALRSSKHPELS